IINVLSSLFGAAKNVHQIELIRRVGQARVSHLAQNFSLIRIDRDDAVTALLHIPRDAETGANRVGRQSDDRDRFALVEDSFDNLRVVDIHSLKCKCSAGEAKGRIDNRQIGTNDIYASNELTASDDGVPQYRLQSAAFGFQAQPTEEGAIRDQEWCSCKLRTLSLPSCRMAAMALAAALAPVRVVNVTTLYCMAARRMARSS